MNQHSNACRARLSYEQFSQFLTSIKELNAGRQSREDTLRRWVEGLLQSSAKGLQQVCCVLYLWESASSMLYEQHDQS